MLPPNLRVTYRGRSRTTGRKQYRLEELLPGGRWTCLASGDRNAIRRTLASARPDLLGSLCLLWREAS